MHKNQHNASRILFVWSIAVGLGLHLAAGACLTPCKGACVGYRERAEARGSSRELTSALAGGEGRRKAARAGAVQSGGAGRAVVAAGSAALGAPVWPPGLFVHHSGLAVPGIRLNPAGRAMQMQSLVASLPVAPVYTAPTCAVRFTRWARSYPPLGTCTHALWRGMVPVQAALFATVPIVMFSLLFMVNSQARVPRPRGAHLPSAVRAMAACHAS